MTPEQIQSLSDEELQAEREPKNEYPLYPTLSEQGKREAAFLITDFRDKLKKVADEVLSNLYTDIACYVESDSWTNFRNELVRAFQDYGNRKFQGEYDFKAIRRKIFEEYREEIIPDLNQDMVEEIAQLKKDVEHWRTMYQMSQRSRI